MSPKTNMFLTMLGKTNSWFFVTSQKTYTATSISRLIMNTLVKIIMV